MTGGRPYGVESELTWAVPGGELDLSHLSEIVETLSGLVSQGLPGSVIAKLDYNGEHLVIRLRDPIRSAT